MLNPKSEHTDFTITTSALWHPVASPLATEDHISFPNSISIHDISSIHGVKPGDSVSNDILTFLQSQLDDIKRNPAGS